MTLYRFFDSDNRLLYVGISYLPAIRWLAHEAQQAWWPDVATIRVEHFPDRESAHAAELTAILTETPVYNRAGATVPKLRLAGDRRTYGTGSVFYSTTRRRWVALQPSRDGRRPARMFHAKEQAEAFLDHLADRPEPGRRMT